MAFPEGRRTEQEGRQMGLGREGREEFSKEAKPLKS
jgi:hypothetical protein